MKILLTGGTGFLGRGFLRHLARSDSPTEHNVTVYSRDEGRQHELQRQHPQVTCVLGDIRDTQRLEAVAAGHDILIHMAALKRIPEAELNAAECLAVNVGGAESVIRAARAAGVSRVVGISTDKAVKPVNIYGASKMAMERLFAEASTQATIFTCTRYGNVIGSTGSVIPLFQRQLAAEGRVTITNPNMTRYWMSVDEAVEVIELALEAEAGSVVIPQPRAMKMTDVAVAAGAPPDEYKLIGERPGEKLHESLLHHEESVRVLRRKTHLELLPSNVHLAGEVQAFTLSSANPDHWMTPDEMRTFVGDAKEI